MRARRSRRPQGIRAGGDSPVSEFWSVVTHPAAAGRPSTAEEAVSFLRSLVEDGGARVWYPGDGFGERLLGWARQLAVMGSRIFDLQIAMMAWENGAREIWTHDRRFACPPDLRVLDPL